MEKYIGTYVLANCGGLMIKTVNDNKIYFDVVTDKILSTHKSKLYYSRKGVYFKFGNSRIYLDDVMSI